jgi:PhnB protein
MAKPVTAIPPGYHTVTPHLVVNDGARAIEFYKQAFGAEELGRMPTPDGKILHAELRIGDSRIMLGDEFPQMGGKSPRSLGGTPLSLMIYTKDVDQAFQRAVQAGATGKRAPQNEFWGDRYCSIEDPFGHSWALATHVEDVSFEEMNERAKKLFSKP